MIKKLQIGMLICALLCGGFPSLKASAAVAWPEDVTVSAGGACVMDAGSGAVLYGKNEDTAYYPASITKVMTALLVLENCEDLSEMVTFSQAAVRLEEDNAVIIGASEGDRLSVQDCLYSMLLKSANETANALAEHVGAKFPELHESGMSDREVFVEMMNRRAAELGCTNTHFNNPSGLTDPDHYTTAHDMCLILAAAVKNERFLEIESHTYWTHAPIKRYPDPSDPWNTVYMSHRMLRKNSRYYYPGVIAGKTGYTMTAGNTLVTACRKNGMTLVVTVLNGHQTHYDDTEALLNFGYENFHSLTVSEYDRTGSEARSDFLIDGLPIANATLLTVSADSRVTLPKEEEFAAVTTELSYELDSQAAPTAVAKLLYRYEGRLVGSAYLETQQIGRSTQLSALESDPLYLRYSAVMAPDYLETQTEAADSTEAGNDGQIVQNAAMENTGESGAKEQSSGQVAETDTNPAEKKTFFSGLHVPVWLQRVFMIAGIVICVLLIVAVFVWHREKQEAQKRARRRQQRLKHTRDLTGQQHITMDLMVQKRLGKRKRRRKP